MRRAYLIGGLLFGAALVVAAITLITNQVSIPDAPAPDLHLSGRLLLAGQEGASILDLGTGGFSAVFTPGQGGLLTAASLSPDGSTLALAYAPPSGAMIQFGYTNLYSLPVDGSQPPKQLVDGKSRDVITSPVWASDGRTIDAVRSGPSADGLVTQLSIEAVAFPSGVSKVVVADGFSPDLSADGAQLAYVAMTADGSADSLFVAAVDGRGPVKVAGGQKFLAIDRPRFSPDGQWIVFSGDQSPFAANTQSRRAPGADWTDLLGGVRTASAHSMPTSDLWRIAASGGTPQKLIKLLASGIMADYSPDGEHIAFITAQGLYVMAADGTGAVRIDKRNTFTSVEWLPD